MKMALKLGRSLNALASTISNSDMEFIFNSRNFQSEETVSLSNLLVGFSPKSRYSRCFRVETALDGNFWKLFLDNIRTLRTKLFSKMATGKSAKKFPLRSSISSSGQSIRNPAAKEDSRLLLNLSSFSEARP